MNMIQRIESKQKYEWEIIEECSKLLKVGLKKSNSLFSRSLFWISTMFLTALIFTAYLTMTFSTVALQSMGLSCNSSSVGMNFLHSFMSGLPQPAC
jgi:hypothetical protein